MKKIKKNKLGLVLALSLSAISATIFAASLFNNLSSNSDVMIGGQKVFFAGDQRSLPTEKSTISFVESDPSIGFVGCDNHNHYDHYVLSGNANGDFKRFVYDSDDDLYYSIEKNDSTVSAFSNISGTYFTHTSNGDIQPIVDGIWKYGGMDLPSITCTAFDLTKVNRIQANPLNIVCDGEEHNLIDYDCPSDVESFGLHFDDAYLNYLEYSYSFNGGAYSGWSTSIPKGKVAGEYKIKVRSSNKASLVLYSEEEHEFSANIRHIEVKKPTNLTLEYFTNIGTEFTKFLANTNAPYTITSIKKDGKDVTTILDVGTYTVTFSLKNKIGYVWAGSKDTNDVTVTITINPITNFEIIDYDDSSSRTSMGTSILTVECPLASTDDLHEHEVQFDKIKDGYVYITNIDFGYVYSYGALPLGQIEKEGFFAGLKDVVNGDYTDFIKENSGKWFYQSGEVGYKYVFEGCDSEKIYSTKSTLVKPQILEDVTYNGKPQQLVDFYEGLGLSYGKNLDRIDDSYEISFDGVNWIARWDYMDIFDEGYDGAYKQFQTVDAGEYKVYFRNTASINFNGLAYDEDNYVIGKILKANSSLANAPTAVTGLEYDGTSHALVNAGSGVVGGTLQYSLTKEGTYSETIPTATKGGSYEVWYKVVGDKNHNNTEPQKVDVTIAKPKATLGNAPTAKTTLVYTGTAQTLVNAGSNVVGGTLKYSTTKNGTYSETIPTGTNTGNYTVWYKVFGDEDHEDTEPQSVSISIGKTNPSLGVAPTAKTTLAYTGNAQSLVNAGSGVVGGTLKYSLTKNGTYTTTIPTGTNAGNYTVWYKIVGDTNHNDSEPQSVNVTIDKADSTFNTDNAVLTYTYNGNEQTLNSGVTSNNNETSVAYTNNKFTNVGSYTVGVSVAETTNYKANSTTLTVNVNKANSSLATAPTAKTTLVYNGNAQTLANAGSGAVGGTLMYSLTENGTYTTTIPTGTNAGNYEVWYKVVGDANHNDTTAQKVDVTIAKTASSLATAPTAKTTLVYNGSAQSLVNAGNGAVGGTLKYCLTENGTYTTTIPTGTNAGNYEVWYKVVGDANHNDTTAQKVDVTIAKADSTFDTENAELTYTYNGEEQTLNSGVTSNNNETSVVYTNNKFTNVGSYTVTASVAETTNYKANSTTLTVNVNKANSLLETAPTAVAGLEYDGTSQTLANAGNGAVGGTLMYSSTENGTYTTTIPTGTNAGNYEVWYKVVGDANHNDTTAQKVDVAIAKISSSLETAPTAKTTLVYNGSAQTLANAGSDVVGGTLQYSLTKDGTYSATIPTRTNAGNYEVWYKVVGDANHNDTSAEKIVVSIAKANPSLTKAPTAKTTLVYNGNAQTLADAGNGAVGGTLQYSLTKDGTYSTTIPTRTNAGNYEVWYKVVGDANHVDSTAQKINVKIEKADSTFNTDNAVLSYTYNGGEQTLNSGVSSNNNETSVVYTNNKFTNTGTYTVDVSIAETNNFKANSTTLTVNVNKADYDMSKVSFNDKTVKTSDNVSNIKMSITGELPVGADNIPLKVTYINNENTECGVYEVKAVFSTDSTNYNVPNEMSAKLTILWVKDSVKHDDTNKDVVIITSDEGLDPSLKLKVDLIEVEKENEHYIEAQEAVMKDQSFNTSKDKIFAVYDVSLLDQNNVKVQPNGTIKVYMSIPEELSGANYRIYHIHNGVAEKVDYVIEDDYAVVTTNKLSEFAVVYEQTSLLPLMIILGSVSILGIVGIVLQVLSMKKNEDDSDENKKVNVTKAMAAAPIFLLPHHLEIVIVLAVIASIVIIVNVVLFITRKNNKTK